MKVADVNKKADYALDQALKVTEFLSSLLEKQTGEIRKLRAEKKELNGLLRLALDMVKSGSKGLN